MDRPDNESALLVMQRVRARLVTEHPFFGDLALRLVLKEDRKCRDLWTDGRTMAFNPLFVSAMGEDRLAGAQAHEVLHLVFGHHLRRRDREKTLWNRACDLAVNSILVESGFHLPDGFLYNADFAGKTADDIYDILLSRIAEDARRASNQRQGKDRPSPQGGARQDSFGGQNNVRLGISTPNDGQAGNREGEDRDRSRQEGRGVKPVAGRQSAGKKADGPPPRFDGEVRDLPDLVDGEGADDARRAAEQEAEVSLTQAVSRARNMGTLPAGLVRHVEHAVPASLDWREILRRFLASCADNDYTWTTPNRRYLFQDIYMPSRWEQRLKHVVVAVDSSGSVDEPTLALFLSELNMVLESYDTTLTVLFHDTKVQKVQTVSRFDEPGDLSPVGGGGTDFRPVPEAVEKEGIEPACLLWFTDLQCSRFPQDPGYPVLWVCSRRGGDSPPFGEIVYLDAETA
ncbi:MAG: VWA-like domain-containing protein [Desulfovibrionaceae bacterium]|nr:VWA-like domain-containing protein [Desulfovibrionaceae bacterium]